MAENWLRTDSFRETVSALEAFADDLRRVDHDAYRWKWAILSLHSTLQGTMVLALQASHGLHALREKDAIRWLDAHACGGPYPTDLKLDDFLSLYNKIKSDLMLTYIHSSKFRPHGTQGASIKKLNRLRNQFVHFTPGVWLLEIDGLPAICNDCLDIADYLAWQSNNVMWPNSDLATRAEAAFKAARRSLASLL
jgi:hypothetical protein